MTNAGLHQRRTQFDAQLLPETAGLPAPETRNHGRHVAALADGSVLTAFAWGGDQPLLRIWRDHDLLAEHALDGPPSPPILSASGLWITVGNTVCMMDDMTTAPRPLPDVSGRIDDVALLPDGRALPAVVHEGRLRITDVAASIEMDDEVGLACMEVGPTGALHVAYEKREGIEYRRLCAESLEVVHAERVAEAFGFQPTLLAADDAVLLAYLGESCRRPSYKHWSDTWERLGHGGYIAGLVLRDGTWQRFRLADSQQIAERLRPTDGAYGGGDFDTLRVRIEEFSAPSLALGPDGVPQVVWANIDRRWVFGSRFLGDGFSPAAEIRGPFEQLAGPCPMPRRTPSDAATLPLAVTTKSRTYLDAVRLPARVVPGGRRIDFVQPDELAVCRGLVLKAHEMERRSENPIIPIGPKDSFDAGAVVANIFRDGDGWRADYAYKGEPPTPIPDRAPWLHGGRAVSDDGICWKKLDPVDLAASFTVNGTSDNRDTIRFIEDSDEPNAARRFKGFWRDPSANHWVWLAVTSPDGIAWTVTDDPASDIYADDDLRLWVDLEDTAARRFKASAISRSHPGRVFAQWTSPDGVHWDDVRETLDFADPFGAKPDRGTTGRILVDPWAGPDDEDEIHGGYVFRDGDRWLAHYMKWTADGHIYMALASSRDGINFTRVAGGAPTLPLGEPGTWDAGRCALREGPFRVGDVWRQYYTGCGWKHGMQGMGAGTSQIGFNAPNQMGAAEIPVGHWASLQLDAEADAGELTTVPLDVQTPHALAVDVAGLARRGSAVRIALFDAETGDMLPGFGYDDCDAIAEDGRAVAATWRGEPLPTGPLRIGVCIAGHGVRLFGLSLNALA